MVWKVLRAVWALARSGFHAGMESAGARNSVLLVMAMYIFEQGVVTKLALCKEVARISQVVGAVPWPDDVSRTMGASLCS